VLRELGLLAVVLLAFLRLHAAAGHDLSAAAIHARTLQALERSLGLDIELSVNGWLVGQPVLITLAVLVYRSYYLAVLGVLVWVYVRHAEVYRKVRRALVAMLVLILPVYWAMPMSPPRFAEPGVVDIVAEHDVVNGHRPDGYTAMPSNHVALSAWCAYAVWLALRPTHPRLALLAWLFPLLMTAVVLTTGNHYVLDVVGSAVLLGASIGVASVWGRLADPKPLASHG
jgi:hypothetical protein